MITPSITFVSLGPGDPELITVKGLRILNEADDIFCPSTTSLSGVQLSRSLTILRALNINTDKVILFDVPMKKDRQWAEKVYDNVFEQASLLFASQKKVVIVAEGDSGFYTSIHYIYDRFVRSGIAVSRIPGIPSFIAASAARGVHIVKQEERLMVIPGNTTKDELSALHNQNVTVVIMKLSQCRDEVIQFLEVNDNISFDYFENIGSSEQYMTSVIEMVKERKNIYFSLLIIHP